MKFNQPEPSTLRVLRRKIRKYKIDLAARRTERSHDVVSRKIALVHEKRLHQYARELAALVAITQDDFEEATGHLNDDRVYTPLMRQIKDETNEPSTKSPEQRVIKAAKEELGEEVDFTALLVVH